MRPLPRRTRFGPEYILVGRDPTNRSTTSKTPKMKRTQSVDAPTYPVFHQSPSERRDRAYQKIPFFCKKRELLGHKVSLIFKQMILEILFFLKIFLFFRKIQILKIFSVELSWNFPGISRPKNKIFEQFRKRRYFQISGF